MFIWNNPELKELRQRTAKEPMWRRYFAIMLGLVFLIGAGTFGAILGLVAILWFKDGLIITNLNDLMSFDLTTIHMISALVPMAILIPLSIVAWEHAMHISKIASKDTIRRIKKFGPY